MPYWVIKGQLAIASRPGYRPGTETLVPRHAVESWADEARALGIVSIICLLDGDQLPLYDHALEGGLLGFYRDAGFHVAHVPTPDGLARPYTEEQLEDIWNAFTALPKPVLVHCSAGMDRTGHAVRHILHRLASNGSL